MEVELPRTPPHKSRFGPYSAPLRPAAPAVARATWRLRNVQAELEATKPIGQGMDGRVLKGKLPLANSN